MNEKEIQLKLIQKLNAEFRKHRYDLQYPNKIVRHGFNISVKHCEDKDEYMRQYLRQYYRRNKDYRKYYNNKYYFEKSKSRNIIIPNNPYDCED